MKCLIAGNTWVAKMAIKKKLSVLYKELYEKWNPLKFSIESKKEVEETDCPFCVDCENQNGKCYSGCSGCRIDHKLCKFPECDDLCDDLYTRILDEINSGEKKTFKKIKKEGIKLIKKNYESALKNE